MRITESENKGKRRYQSREIKENKSLGEKGGGIIKGPPLDRHWLSSGQYLL